MRRNKERHPPIVTAESFEMRFLLSSASIGTVRIGTDPTGVSSRLLALANGTVNTQQIPNYIYDSSGRIDVKITAQDVTALAAPLAAIGFAQTGIASQDHFIEGFIPLGALQTINSLTSDGLMGVLPIDKPGLSTGKVDSEGDSILEADRTRAVTGVTGSGVTVGVLSDSYNNLSTAAADVASGDLPNNVNVLEDLSSGGTDEGRAMLQIVHDLAPGANLAFATAYDSQAGFAQNILNLAAPVSSGGAGANVIVDDVYYFDEPFFQDGIISQAINTVATNSNVSYFSAAGNEDTQSYESTNVSFYSDTIPGISGGPAQYYNFNPTGSPADQQSVSLNNYQALDIGFEWDQPFYTTNGVTSQINLYLLNSTTGVVVASATANDIANQEPYQELYYANTTGNNASYDLVITLASGPTPGRIKYVDYGDGYDVSFNNYFTNSSTITPHSGAANAFSVAAAPSYSQRTIESYSSEGPFTEVFDASGNRLPSPVVRAKPDATAIDGVSTTFFGQSGYDGYPQFYGTSAAAPHAAAVAALIKSANPAWTPAQIYADLKATADPNIGSGNVNFIGAGLIDAYRAIVGAAVPAVASVFDGFESGYLGRDWTTYNAGIGQTEVESGNSPASGNYQLIESGIADAYYDYVLSEAILNLNIPSYASNVTLNFSQKKFFNSSYANYELDYPMPATFTGNGDYEGVALSVDGTHWYSIISLTGSNSTTSYQSHTFNLSQIATADGLTLGSNTQIKFQYYDTLTFNPPDGGFAFDNVAVTSALSLVGPAYYLELDPDQLHLDIWNANSSAGAIFASIATAGIASLTFTGTSSPQSLTVDFTNGTPFTGGVVFNASGSAASNQLLVIGTAVGSDTVASSAGVLMVNGTSLTATDIGSQTFIPGTGTDTLALNSGTLILAPRGGTGITTDLFTSIVLASGSRLTVRTPITHATRTLVDTATLTIAGSVNAWSGVLDLSGNDLAVTSGNQRTITNQLSSGFAKGAWNGNGISSSLAAADTSHLTALAGIPNTTNGSTPLYGAGLPSGPFDGTSPGAAAVLVKYTYLGDADLSGKVDGTDYSRIDTGFLSHSTGWINGDFNYDGVVNGSDYTLIDNTFNRQGASLASQTVASVNKAPAQRRIGLPTSLLAEPITPAAEQSVFSVVSVAMAIFHPQSGEWWKRAASLRFAMS